MWTGRGRVEQTQKGGRRGGVGGNGLGAVQDDHGTGSEVGGPASSIFMHGRSRMTIDPRIPTMPGRSTPGFHQSGRHCLRQARGAVRCSASRLKG